MTPSNGDAARFDDVFNLVNAPVTVVGAARDGVLGGLTAAWVTRVSMDPPLLLVAVGHERHTHGLLTAGGEFTVSILAEGQVAEARLFGLHSRRDRDKWAETPHVIMGDTVPALERCSGRLLCRVENVVTAGDHDLYVGRVLVAEMVDGKPILPLRGRDYAPDVG